MPNENIDIVRQWIEQERYRFNPNLTTSNFWSKQDMPVDKTALVENYDTPIPRPRWGVQHWTAWLNDNYPDEAAMSSKILSDSVNKINVKQEQDIAKKSEMAFVIAYKDRLYEVGV